MEEEYSEDEATQTIALRMIQFFYDSMAIGRDAWNVAFWDEFRCKNLDVSMDSKQLRSYFFNGIMRNADNFEGLSTELSKYINPLFNRIRDEVLEYRDLVEGIDFVFDRNATSLAVGTALPPIQLQPSSAFGVLGLSSANRGTTPTTEQILFHVSNRLSELVWTEDEKSSKPSLSMSDCLQRIAVLTQNGIPLLKCIEPGMSCYERFREMGFLEPFENDQSNTDGSADGYEQFQAPQGISTPLSITCPVPLASRKDSALGQSINEGEKNSRQLYQQQPSCSYRTPTGLMMTNYDSTLKHIRSKRRRFMD